ncbi:hypothetical protein Droror1_Dr00001953 [Drosera rotundifolia]
MNSRIPARDSAPSPEFRQPNFERSSTAKSGEQRGAETPASCSDEDVEFPVFVDDCAFEFHKHDAESMNRVIDGEDDDEVISDDDDDDRISATQFSSISSRVEGLGFAGSLRIEKERERNNAWDSFCREADEIVNGSVMSRDSKRSRIPRSNRGKSKSKSLCAYNFRRGRSVDCKRQDRDDPFESHWLDGSEDIDCMNVEADSRVGGDEIGDADDEGLLVVGGCHEYVVARNSMAELLDELQCKEESVVSSAIPRVGKKGRRRRVETKRGGSLVGGMDCDDPLEDLHSGLSTDEERDAGIICATSVNVKSRSVADRFEEALGADKGAAFAVPRKSNAGLLWRLQSLMQREKEQDLEFLRKLHSKASLSDEASSMIVKILSRSFDAKLTVCCCGMLDKKGCPEESYQGEGFVKTRTIIFSSRICGGIDLEVGKLILIHAPWKEVEVLGEGDAMVLAAYFSYV